ncbi:MAG: hypothetical protein AMXMBFR4_08250 [Candidatus Hydrogenedentota bacterium]
MSKKEQGEVLTEFCKSTGYHRKYAVTLLKRVEGKDQGSKPRRRGTTYSAAAMRVIERIWKAAGYPWSVRLKAMLPSWLPRTRRVFFRCNRCALGGHALG